MKSLQIVCLVFLAVAPSNAGTKGIEPPVLLKKVEPDITGLPPDSLVELTRVDIVVDAEGKPFALKSADGLPDNVVNALAQWRFKPGSKNGVKTPFALSYLVPVHQPLTPILERSLGHIWYSNTGLLDVFARAKQWDVAAMKKAEERLSVDSDRQQLIHGAALLHALFTGTPEQVHQARIEHLLPMIQNAPELDILGTPVALIGDGDEPLADSALRAQVAQLWLQQVSAAPENLAVLDHAINFLQFTDPRKASTLAMSVKNWFKTAIWQGHEFGLRGIGVSALDPRSGAPIIRNKRIPDTPFEVAARTALLQSGNIRLVLAALAAVGNARQVIGASGGLPDGFDDFCSALSTHAKQLYPHTSLSCDGTGPIQADVFSTSTGESVFAAKLNKRIRPRYPQEAKEERIQGNVSFLALINRDGKVQNLKFMSGPLVFYASTRQAVSQWEYVPATLNGEPVEVETEITTNYTLETR